MIKKPSQQTILNKMTGKKLFTILLILITSIATVTAQDATNVNLFENSPNDGATITGDDVTFDYGIEEFNTQEGTLELRAETCTASGETLATHTPPTQTTTSYTTTESYENCYGTFNWYLFYEGADGSTTDSGIYPSFTIESDASQVTGFTASSPSDGTVFNGDINQEKDVTFEVGVESPQDKGVLEIVVDGVVVDTSGQIPSGSSQIYTTTQTISDGSHSWNARFVGVDDSETTTGTNDFTVQDYADRVSGLSISNPTDGETFSSGTTSVDVSYGGSGGGDGDVNLYLNGNQQTSNTWNGQSSNSYTDTLTGLSSGTYEVYVEYVGDDGSTTQTTATSFTIEGENTPSFTLDNPTQGQTILKDPGDSTTQVNYKGSFDTGFSGTYEIIRDGTVIKTDSFSSGTTNYDFTEPLSTGNYSYKVEVTSDSTGNPYTSNTVDFSVEELEETVPTIYNRNPSDGESFTYNNATENGATINFEGEINAPYSGNGTLTVYNGTQQINFSYTHTPSQTTVTGTETLGAGTYDYQVFFTSDQTGNTYYTNLTEFTVQTSTETSPVQTLDAPSGTFSRAIFDRTLEYNVSVDANYNTTNTLKVKYGAGGLASGVDVYEQTLFRDILIEPSESLGANLFGLNNNEATTGTYVLELTTTSQETGINYTKTQTFEVTSEPNWNGLIPNDTSVPVDGLENFKQTNFKANISNVEPGELQYQIKQPGSTKYSTIYTTNVNNYNDVNLDFDNVIQGIKYNVNINDTLYSQNYTTRVLYSRDTESTTYTSPTATFNYVGNPGLIEDVSRWANDTFGDNGTVIVATLILMLSSVYVGLFGNGTAVLMVILAEATTFSIIGWYPGWVAFLLFMFGIGIGYKLFQDGGG